MAAVLRSLLVGLLAALPLAVAAPGLAQSRAASEPHLTQAAVALMVESTREPETERLLGIALTSVNTHVRRIAARVVRTSRLSALRPALIRGLADESPDSITYEEIASAIESLDGARPVAERGSVAGGEPEPPGAPAATGLPRLRLWPWVTPTLARDLLRATECRLPDGAPFIAALVDYRPTGTVNRGVVNGEGLSDACKRAGRVLAALTLAPPGRAIRAGVQEMVVMAFDSDHLACLEGRTKPGKAPRRVTPIRIGDSAVQAPQKIRNVNPVYPQVAVDQRVQGLVTLEATVTTEGCVQNLEVTRSVSPHLDFAALRAVMRWRYAPALLNGEPVPVIMTVTANFSLQP